VGAGSVVLRDVPDNSTIVGVPGHIILRAGQRGAITDTKQIQDPLSEALAAVATQVKDLKERLQKLEGSEPSDSRSADELQAIIDYQI
jgi:serine O-acetyltransferase